MQRKTLFLAVFLLVIVSLSLWWFMQPIAVTPSLAKSDAPNSGELSDFGALFLAALLVFSGGMAIKGRKLALRIFGTGLAVLIIEGFALLLGGLNEKYFHIHFLEQCVNTYFAWTKGYVGLMAGILLIFTGLAIGLFGTRVSELGKS